MRWIVLCLAMLAGAAQAEGVTAPEPPVDPASFEFRMQNLMNGPAFSQGCCKTCRKGKACGNSCISTSKSCRVGPGCACNG